MSDILQQTRREMDEALASVMPDSWHGHARLIIHQRDLSGEDADLATRASRRLLEQGTTDDATVAAKAVLKKVEG